MIQSKSVDYHRDQLIRQIRTAKQLAAECNQQAQQPMKLYYDHHAKDHPFRLGYKVWIYNTTFKQGLSKKYFFPVAQIKSLQYPLKLPIFKGNYRKAQYT